MYVLVSNWISNYKRSRMSCKMQHTVYMCIYINYRYTQHIYIYNINYRYTHTQLLTHGHPGDGIWAIPTILNHAYEPLSGKDGFPLMNRCLRANPQCIE